MRSADLMIAVSHRMERDVQRLFPGTRTATLHNGSDPLPESVLNAPRPPELLGKKVVLSVGGFYIRKGMPILVRAFAKIAARHPDAVLRIVGDGEDRPAVDQAVRASGLHADRITLLGTQPREVALREIAMCDIFALVGWDEPFGIVYVEAMSAAKPVVCCDDAGVNDVLRDGVHGITVPPHDVDAVAAALDRLLVDGDARRAMGAAGHQLFRSRLTWDANAQALNRMLCALVNRSSPSDTAASARRG
jgi:glycosyltransferase involved in cell wall biosynthesis